MAAALDRQGLIRGIDVLCARDADLARLFESMGPPPLWPREPGFPTLVRLILEQQVSLASAEAAFNRLLALVAELTPASFLTLTDTALKTAGFSRQKTRYCRGLAEGLAGGALDLETLSQLDDEEVLAVLTRVKGIGPWTAQNYMLMALRRADAWPAGDLALAVAVQRVKGLETRPDTAALIEIGEAWRPWRAVAARMLWHYYLNGD